MKMGPKKQAESGNWILNAFRRPAIDWRWHGENGPVRIRIGNGFALGAALLGGYMAYLKSQRVNWVEESWEEIPPNNKAPSEGPKKLPGGY